MHFVCGRGEVEDVELGQGFEFDQL